jgi:hypothetical protein
MRKLDALIESPDFDEKGSPVTATRHPDYFLDDSQPLPKFEPST